jgi:hypothetical protein
VIALNIVAMRTREMAVNHRPVADTLTHFDRLLARDPGQHCKASQERGIFALACAL